MGKFLTLRRADLRARTEGQSIPLIALMLVVLIGMVALSVDAGNTYAEQRKLVAATDAAAIAGLQKYLEPGSKSDADVLKAIQESFKANDINLDDGYNERNFTAVYLDSLGRELPQEVGVRGNGAPPSDATYIQVKSDGKVETFFARLVGRPELPVRYASYAGTCPPGAGIYPIAVDAGLFTADRSRFEDSGVVDEYGTMPSDRNGSHWGSETVTWRRIYLEDSGNLGGFGWLRWSEQQDSNGYGATTKQAFSSSLTGSGNATIKFEEIDPSPLPAESPAGYPIQPSTANPGDWVYEGPGMGDLVGDTEVKNLLNGHMYTDVQPGTLMTLPIFDKTIPASEGESNGGYRIARFGTFVLKDLYMDSGDEMWLELIYLPNPPRTTACTVTPPAPTSLSLRGEVSFLPVHVEDPDEIKPVHYLVVLDVSGSMNFSFKGYGRDPDTDAPIWCDGDRSKYPFGATIENVTLDDGTTSDVKVVKCEDGNWQNYPFAWEPIEQRRIYVAKNALKHLVEQANMPGNTNYTNSRPADEMMLIWFNDRQESGWKTKWLSKPTDLKNSIDKAGRVNNANCTIDSVLQKPCFYFSSGGTNGAAGLYRANDQLSQKPREKMVSGKNWEFKQVIIYVTDGVSNNFLDINSGNLSGGGNNNTGYFYQTDSLCKNLDGKIPGITTCHLSSDEGPVTISGGTGQQCTPPPAGGFDSSCYDRPITQMIKQGDILRSNEIEVHVIGLSDFDKTGLGLVAGSSANLHTIRQVETYGDGKTNVDLMMEYINRRITDQDCQVIVDTEPKDTMTQSQAPTQIFTWPRVGTVFLIDANGNSLSTPINVGDDGKLTYEFRELPEGTYTLKAEIGYVHPDDGNLQMYNQLQVGERILPEVSIGVSYSPEYTGGKNLLLKTDNEAMCSSDE